MARPQFIDIPVDELVFDPDAQMRVEGLSPDHVLDLRAAIKAKAKLPEPRVRKVEGKGFVITDGMHTATAYMDEGRKTVRCRVEPGDWLDVVIDAAGANIHDGAALKRTADDKRKAVAELVTTLAKFEKKWSTKRIAEHTKTSRTLVDGVLAELAPQLSKDSCPGDEEEKEPEFTETKDGRKFPKRMKRKRTPSTNGKPVPSFDWKPAEAAMGVLQRCPDDAARVKPELRQTTEYAGLVRLLGEVADSFKALKRLALKEGKS